MAGCVTAARHARFHRVGLDRRKKSGAEPEGAMVGETVLARIREKVIDRVLQLPAPVLDKVRTGDLLSRVGDDVASMTKSCSRPSPRRSAP